LTTTNSFSKWVEAIPNRFIIDALVIKFLEENILARFRCPRKIITDNAQAFKSLAMIVFLIKNTISLFIIQLPIILRLTD
jgi:hypothetical protein